MLFSKDRDFTDALGNAEALETRLIALQKHRKLSRLVSGFSMFVFFFGIFVSFYLLHMRRQPGPAAIVASLMAFNSLLFLAAASSAQSDIRTLLAMKKLLGFEVPDN